MWEKKKAEDYSPERREESLKQINLKKGDCIELMKKSRTVAWIWC